MSRSYTHKHACKIVRPAISSIPFAILAVRLQRKPQAAWIWSIFRHAISQRASGERHCSTTCHSVNFLIVRSQECHTSKYAQLAHSRSPVKPSARYIFPNNPSHHRRRNEKAWERGKRNPNSMLGPSRPWSQMTPLQTLVGEAIPSITSLFGV